MRVIVKMTVSQLLEARQDLARPHGHAYERVGFLTGGVSQINDATLCIFVQRYLQVEDEDYVKNPAVGAMIGPNAMRKALQEAYKTKASLLHIHTHSGKGVPRFSRVDIVDGAKFVPGFFGAIPKMPHGLIVLSDNDASGLIWLNPKNSPVPVAQFVQVGAPFLKQGVP